MSKRFPRAVYDIIAFNLALLILLGVYFPLSVKILLYFSAVLYTLLIVFLILIWRPKEFFPDNILTLPVGLFFLAVELSVLLSVNEYQSQKFFFSRFLGYMLAFFLGAAAARDRKTERFLPLVFFIGSLVITAGGLWDYWRLAPPRLFTSFGTEVHWPVMLGIYMPFSASLILFSDRKKLKISGLVCFGLLSFCMLFHAARSVWAGIIFIVGILFVLKKQRWLFVLGLSVLLAVFLFSPYVRYRIQTVFHAETKLNMNRPALEIFEDFPVTGAGLATFEVLKPIYAPDAYLDYIHTDNTYTEIMAENGLLGLTAFIWIFVVFFREAAAVIKRQLEKNNIDPLMLGLVGGIMALAIINIATNAVTVGFQNAVIFWIVLGYASALVSRARLESE